VTNVQSKVQALGLPSWGEVTVRVIDDPAVMVGWGVWRAPGLRSTTRSWREGGL
jgi:hypothetical protein